mmetsp:Transcript_1692/g.3235  ORF Transcript_1692/g.3235 Transcript_1692/m.3235 type:complete len:241 (-) Transcript_1692:460-1182(-)
MPLNHLQGTVTVPLASPENLMKIRWTIGLLPASRLQDIITITDRVTIGMSRKPMIHREVTAILKHAHAAPRISDLSMCPCFVNPLHTDARPTPTSATRGVVWNPICCQRSVQVNLSFKGQTRACDPPQVLNLALPSHLPPSWSIWMRSNRLEQADIRLRRSPRALRTAKQKSRSTGSEDKLADSELRGKVTKPAGSWPVCAPESKGVSSKKARKHGNAPPSRTLRRRITSEASICTAVEV